MISLALKPRAPPRASKFTVLTPCRLPWGGASNTRANRFKRTHTNHMLCTLFDLSNLDQRATASLEYPSFPPNQAPATALSARRLVRRVLCVSLRIAATPVSSGPNVIASRLLDARRDPTFRQGPHAISRSTGRPESPIAVRAGRHSSAQQTAREVKSRFL